jgi:hypothetical protein
MLIDNFFLKFIYNGFLTGMPSILNNPFNKNTLYSPFIVKEYSTYFNYKLDNENYIKIQNLISNNNNNNNNNNNFELIKTNIFNSYIDIDNDYDSKDDEFDYYLSINIYNCTSPLFDFISNDNIIRCEINTYVTDKVNDGTLIIDYASNKLSLDPDNLFKKPDVVNFIKNDDIISGSAFNKNFNLKFNYSINNYVKREISSKLISLTDIIFYNCGIYDKVYYDSNLINNELIKCLNYNIKFDFYDLNLTKLDSVFFFKNEITFLGGLWKNLYQ